MLGPTRAIWRQSSAPIEPPGAGDEHDAPGQVGAHALDLHPHGLAAEDVLHAHLAHLAQQAPTALQQLEDRRHRAHGHAALAARGHHARAHAARGRGHRDQDLVGLDVLEHARQVVRAAEHLDAAVDARAALARVVVDEADRAVAEVRIAQDLAQQQAAAVAGADDQHGAGVARRAIAGERALVDQVHEEAPADEEEQHQQPVEHEHAGGDGDRDEALTGER